MAKKRAKKESKKAARIESKQRKASAKRSRWMTPLIIVAILAGGGWWYAQQDQDLPGRQFENQGRQHVPNGTPPPIYNSSPPTSGAHSSPAPWGERSNEIPLINQVHNLEHGGVLIQYNCSQRPPATSCYDAVAQLRDILSKARRDIDKKIVLAPFGGMERFIAVTSWTWLQYFDRVDEEGILQFARAHINNAPEQVE